MCHKSPGPRCASHLRAAILTAEAQIAENRRAFAAGHETPHQGVEGRLAQLRDEFDETRTGQDELAATINALENVDADPFEIETVRSRLLNAADRREAKMAALQSTENGDTRAAKYQLRYGAHAGWLARTNLVHDTKANGGPTVFRDYAVGTLYEDVHHEQAGFEERARDILVTDTSVVYEAPVVRGPREGTWVTGGTVPRTNAAPRMMPTAAAFYGNRSHQPVQPVLYDETVGAVAPYDPKTGQTLADPVPVGTLDGLDALDYNDGLDLCEVITDGNVAHLEAKVSVVETSDYSFVLRGTFAFSVIR